MELPKRARRSGNYTLPVSDAVGIESLIFVSFRKYKTSFVQNDSRPVQKSRKINQFQNFFHSVGWNERAGWEGDSE